MAIPNLVYNEERPQFIGKDVEGIKELNATLAKKYDINKQAKIQTEDLLHSFNTLDQDSPHLTEAIQGFDEELQYIADNNQYERAGQIVEKAVTNVKRNKALEQSVANYGAYQKYVNDLKENPNGWTEQEISSVIGFSSDNYSGVSLDENGQATGTFHGYNPGEKINVLAEFDEALKGFASDKGVEFSTVQKILEDGSVLGFDKKTVEKVDRDEIIAYLNQYYNNDPKINKYYETKAILDTRKDGFQLEGELRNNIGRLDLLSQYTPEYREYLAKEGITAENQEEEGINFMEWMVNRQSNTEYDLRGLMEMAKSDIPEDAQQAKQVLAQVNTMMNKKFDVEAAAIKNGFTKIEVQRNTFKDEMTIYKLKKLADDTEFMFTLDSTAVNYSKQYTSDGGGRKLLIDQIDNLNVTASEKQTQIDNKMKDAIAVGAYDNVNKVWNEPNGIHKRDYDRYVAEKTAIQSELDQKDQYYDAALNYANSKAEADEKLNPEVIAQHEQGVKDFYQSQIDRNQLGATYTEEEVRRSQSKRNTKADYEFYTAQLEKLNRDGIQNYRYNLSQDRDAVERIPTKIFQQHFKPITQASVNRNKYIQEYLDTNSIQTKATTSLPIDKDANPKVKRAMGIVEEDFDKNRSIYMVRDQDGNIIPDPGKGPHNITITDMSTGRFADGEFYYTAIANVIDKEGKVLPSRNKDGSYKKYYISAVQGDINERVGNVLSQNTNPKAAAFGYRLMQPLNWRFETEGIDLVNTPVPITSPNGNKLGTVEINSSETKGVPDFQDVRIKHILPTPIFNQLKDDYPELEQENLFNDKSSFETYLNDLNAIVTTD